MVSPLEVYVGLTETTEREKVMHETGFVVSTPQYAIAAPRSFSITDIGVFGIWVDNAIKSSIRNLREPSISESSRERINEMVEGLIGGYGKSGPLYVVNDPVNGVFYTVTEREGLVDQKNQLDPYFQQNGIQSESAKDALVSFMYTKKILKHLEDFLTSRFNVMERQKNARNPLTI